MPFVVLETVQYKLTNEYNNNNNNTINIIIMAEIAVTFNGLATTNEGDAYGLQFTTSPRGLILNKCRIYNRWHIQRRKPCQLPGWMKNSTYYSATAGIRTSNLPRSMTTSKKIPHSYPLGHKGSILF